MFVFVRRFNDHLDSPAMWSEDGVIFYGPAFNHEASFLTLMFRPYAGYLHAVPHLIGSACALLPIAFGAPAMALSIVLVMSAPIFCLVGPRATFFSVQQRWIVGALYVLLPWGREVTGGVTCSQWWTVTVMTFLLCGAPAATRGQRVAESVAMALFSLTGPFSTFLALLSIAMKPLRANRVIWLICCAGGLVQAVVTATHPVLVGSRLIGVQELMTFLASDNLVIQHGTPLGPFAPWLLLTLLFAFTLRDKNTALTALLLIGIAVPVAAVFHFGTAQPDRYQATFLLASTAAVVPATFLPTSRLDVLRLLCFGAVLCSGSLFPYRFGTTELESWRSIVAKYHQLPVGGSVAYQEPPGRPCDRVTLFKR
jgi:hypothetical protein